MTPFADQYTPTKRLKTKVYRGISFRLTAVLLVIILSAGNLAGCSYTGKPTDGKGTGEGASVSATDQGRGADPEGDSSSHSGTASGSGPIPGAAQGSDPLTDTEPESNPVDPVSPAEKELTLLIYMCGSDLESKAGAASSDLDEILASGMDPDSVNVLVMAGGTTAWKNSFPKDETAVYSVVSAGDKDLSAGDKDLRWEKLKSFASPDQEGAPANMGETGTLRAFLDYGFARCPAREYALIMWDHGGGPMRGLCWDTAWAKDNLTMEEFTDALAESPLRDQKLAWIGFDACLMSSIETAHLVAPYARYMIASEETEPGCGWSYSFLKGIEEDADGSVTGKRIIDSYFEGAEAAGKDHTLTLACTDLSALEHTEQCLDAFFSRISSSLDPESFSSLSQMRQETREFGKAMNDSQRLDLVDLGDLIGHFAPQAPEEAGPLQDALEKMVTYSRSTLSGCSGLSSYHPYYNKTYYEKLWQKVYDTFSFVPSYTGYIKDFASIWLDEALGDWTRINRTQEAGSTQDTQYFTLQLTPDQLNYYASGQLLVLMEVGTESVGNTAYSQVYLTDDVTVDETGLLTAGYNGRTLYATDDSGQVLAGPLSYTLTDDGHLQIKGNYINHESGADQEKTTVMFECADAPSGTDLPILDQYVWDTGTETWSNRLQIIEDNYESLILLLDYRQQTRQGDRILPFEEWETSSWAAGYKIDRPSAVHFRFFDRILTGSNDLFACFQVTDTQANRYGTDLMPVKNPMVTPVRFEDGDQFIYENDLVRLTFSAKTDRSELSKALMLDAVAENLSDRPVSVSLQDGKVIFNEKMICSPERGGLSFSKIAPGKKEAIQAYFSDLSLAGITDVSQIRLEVTCEKEEPETEATNDTTSETTEDSETVSEQIILKPLNLNLSGISEDISDLPVLAELSQDGLDWQLLEMRRKRNGNPVFLLQCRNNGTEPGSVPYIRAIGINGFVMDQETFQYYDPDESILIQPGMEYNLRIEAENRQYEIARMEHLSGLLHLVISDVLASSGVNEIQSLTLYPYTNIAWWGNAEEALRKQAFHFELKAPISLTPQISREEEIDMDRFHAEDSEAGQFRSLDEDGSPPDRVLLSSHRGVNIYGEQILVADRQVLYSLIVENQSDEDAVLRMYNFFINGEDSKTYQRNFISYAGSSMRTYIRFTCPDTVEGDRLEQVSMNIWQDGESLPDVDRITFTFGEGVLFDLDGGISMPVRDTVPVAEVLSTPDDPPLFRDEVICPDDPAGYRKEISFILPDSMTEEERASIQKVTAFVMGDCTDQVDPKIREEKEQEKDSTGVFKKPVGKVILEDPENAGTFSGVFCGLTGYLQEYPEINLLLAQDSAADSGEEFLSFAETGYYYKVGLVPKKDLYTVNTCPSCLLRFRIGNEATGSPGRQTGPGQANPGFTGSHTDSGTSGNDTVSGPSGGTTASLESVSLTEETDYGKYFKIADWPKSWFEKIQICRYAVFYTPSEEGTVKRSDPIYLPEQNIPLSETPLTIRLVPVTEYADDLVVTYLVNFKDGSLKYYDGSAY